MRMGTAGAAIVIASLFTKAALAAPDPPYVGTWQCEYGELIITKRSYDFGEPVRIKSVERKGNWFLLTMVDGYRVTLADVTKSKMTWHSPASGDTFECRRASP